MIFLFSERQTNSNLFANNGQTKAGNRVKNGQITMVDYTHFSLLSDGDEWL